MSITEQSSRRKYRVKVSDMLRSRTVFAHSAEDAIRRAVGLRLINIRHDACLMTLTGDMARSTYEVSVQTGRRTTGFAPFRNVQVTVSHE